MFKFQIKTIIAILILTGLTQINTTEANFTDLKIGQFHFHASKQLESNLNNQPTKSLSQITRIKALNYILNSLHQTENNPTIQFERPRTARTTTETPNESTSTTTPTDEQLLEQAINLNLVNNVPFSKFRPNDNITRAEALKIILTLINADLSATEQQPAYNDTPSTAWHNKFFRYARTKNLFDLPTNREIKPNEFISHGDLFNLIYKAKRHQTSEFGKASFYRTPREIKNPTAQLDYLLTAAHKTLPFGTKVKVTNLRNSLSVIVEITDRGPYVDGAVIDLSRSAFAEIASLSTGIIPIEMEIQN